MTILLPMLFCAAITSYFMTDLDVFDTYLLHAQAQISMHLSMFIAWLQDHLLNLVPFLYLFLLLVFVLVFCCLSWFSVDVDPRPQYLHCANFKSHLCATKPCCCFKCIHRKAPMLSCQADFRHFQNLQHSVDSILYHVCNIATGHNPMPVLCPQSSGHPVWHLLPLSPQFHLPPVQPPSLLLSQQVWPTHS